MGLRILFYRWTRCALIVMVLCLGLLGLSTGSAPPAYSAQVDATWTGGDNGWAAGSWSPNLSPQYPTNGVNGNTYNIFINSGGSVSLDVLPTIDNLTIASGGSLNIGNGKYLLLDSGISKGVVTNSGLIWLNAVDSNTALLGANVKLTGTGMLVMSNDSHNILLSGTNYATLTNDASHTIIGSGSIGSVGNATTFKNSGIVRANQSTPLTLTANVINDGMLEAFGGTLRLDQADVNNSGGIIRGTGGSVVELSSTWESHKTKITGGTLDGTILHSSNTVYLSDLTNLGNYTIASGAGTVINGGITNNGTIKLDAFGGTTGLYVGESTDYALLTGTGKVIMSNDANNVMMTGNNYARLTNDANHTIEGSGSIGSVGHATTLTNIGTVRANQSTPLILTADINNAGILEANGGTLKLQAAKVTNTGIIQGMNSSFVDLSSGTSITGGTLDGTILHSSNTVFLTDLTNQGAYTIASGVETVINGGIVNNGTIKMDAFGGATYLNVGASDNALLTGTGKVIMSNDASNVIMTGNNWASLTNDSGHTIEGSGSIGSGGHATSLTNLGTIRANQSNPLNLYGNAVVNAGTFEAANGGTLNVTTLTNLSGETLTGGSYLIAGTMKLPGNIKSNAAAIVLDGAGSQLLNASGTSALAGFASNTASGSFTIKNGKEFTTAGAFSNTGNMNIAAGSRFTAGSDGKAAYTQSAGATTVNGVLTAGSLSITGGTLSGSGTIDASVISSVAVAPGMSPGMLTINGDYTQTAEGSLLIELGGYSQGTGYDYLSINGDAALAGTLEILLYGGFAPADGSAFDILTADKIVGTFDMFITPDPAWIWGISYLDTDRDSDLDTVRVTANRETPGEVPEPATLLMLALGLLSLVGLGRRNGR